MKAGTRLRVVLCAVALALVVLIGTGCAGPGGAELAAGRAAVQRGDLVEAHQYFETALQLAPGNAKARTELAAVRTQLVDQAIQQAQQAAQSGTSGVREGLNLLDQAAPFDPQGSKLPNARRNLTASLEQSLAKSRAKAKQARTAMKAGRIDFARGEIDAIRSADPAFPDLVALDADLAKAHAAELGRQIEGALAAGDPGAARLALTALQGLDPSQAVPFQGRVDSAEAKWIRERSATDIRAGRYYTAFRRANASKLAPGTLVNELRRDGAAHYLLQARQRMQRGETARAYLEAVKGLELAPEDPLLFEVHRDARDAELAKLQTYVAIPTFAAPSNRPDVGAQFSDALISHLFRVLPYGINIVEREKIDLLIKEQNQGFAQLGEVLNVDLIVSGNVSLLEIDRQESEQEAVARVQVGVRQEANPAYEVAYRLAAQANPNRKPNAADLPAQTIAVPVQESVRYRKGKVTVKGFATVAARIFNTKKASIEYAQEFNARVSAADDYQDGVAGTEITGDPLELPSDTEVVESLRNQLVQKVSDVIQGQFGQRQKALLEEAKYRLARRERDLAVQPLARGFLYCVRAKVPASDAAYSELRDLAVEQTERGFLPRMPAVEGVTSPSDGRQSHVPASIPPAMEGAS